MLHIIFLPTISDTVTRKILIDECNDGNITFYRDAPPTSMSTTLSTTMSTFFSTTTSTISYSTSSIPEWALPVTSKTMTITRKHAGIEGTNKIEKARNCLLNYINSLKNLRAISDWTTATTTTRSWESTPCDWCSSETVETIKMTIVMRPVLRTGVSTEMTTIKQSTNSTSDSRELNINPRPFGWASTATEEATTAWTDPDLATTPRNSFEYKNSSDNFAHSIIFLFMIFML